MCAKMPILIESVGDQGQRVEQGFEWPDDSALKRVEKEGGRQTGISGASSEVQIKGASYDVSLVDAPLDPT
jgi:hypothetical protein